MHDRIYFFDGEPWCWADVFPWVVIVAALVVGGMLFGGQ